MKFTKKFRTQLKVKDLIIVHLQLLIKTRPEVEEVIDVFKNYIKDIKYKYDKEQAIFDWDVTPIDNSKEVIDKITKVMALDIVTGVVQFIEGVRPETTPKPVGSFKRAGHLTDQILKYTYPKDKSPQLSIFDSLLEGTKKDIEVVEVENTEVVEGIKLTPSETKVIDSLCKLLHNNSQTLDTKKEGYYTGNLSPDKRTFGTTAPKLAFTLYELTKEYKGGEAISGKDVDNVKQILTDLNSKKFLIRYTETTKGKKGEWIKKEYEAFRSILFLDLATLRYGVGDIEEYKKKEQVIVLHPIFRRQIDSKFILYPNDINRRIILAYGSHNVSDIALRLRDYLLKELSLKHYKPEIMLDRLYYLVAEKWMRESRKKKVKEYTDKALEVVTGLGILENYKIVPAKTTGEPKVVFTLNKDFK